MNLVKRSRELVDPLVSMSKSSGEDLNLVKTKNKYKFCNIRSIRQTLNLLSCNIINYLLVKMIE